MTFQKKQTKNSTPIIPMTATEFTKWQKKQDKRTQNWFKNTDFQSTTGTTAVLTDQDGAVSKVILIVKSHDDLYAYSGLPNSIPKNTGGYFIDKKLNEEQANNAAMGWALGTYSFDKYKSKSTKASPAKLVWPKKANKVFVESAVAATFMVRDLVNTPTNDMGPEDLAKAAQKLAKDFNKASCTLIKGKDLLKKNFPAIHAVGRASESEPRLIDLKWGKKTDPKVTIVGKGVCFDTGGLNLKPGGSMLLMKKDMGGAAHALGLAHMIMAANLPVRLRVLIPAVENSVNDNAYRPGDIIETRKGISVEIGNTDAEGRLVLADALALASEEKPDLLLDFATLTGAARAALGPDLPAMFTNDDKVAKDLEKSAGKTQDPLWRMPLWKSYLSEMDSQFADTNNVGGQAGAITAALFLERFVEENIPWVHLDTLAWNPKPKPGKPVGGEAIGMRASYDLIKKRFGPKK